MPKVTIFKSESGYTMKVEGSSGTIEVERVSWFPSHPTTHPTTPKALSSVPNT